MKSQEIEKDFILNLGIKPSHVSVGDFGKTQCGDIVSVGNLRLKTWLGVGGRRYEFIANCQKCERPLSLSIPLTNSMEIIWALKGLRRQNINKIRCSTCSPRYSLKSIVKRVLGLKREKTERKEP